MPKGGVSLTQHMAESTFPTQTSQPLWPPARPLHVPPLSSPSRTISQLIIWWWWLCLGSFFFSLWLDASAQSHEKFSWTHLKNQQSEGSLDAADLPRVLNIASCFSRKCSYHTPRSKSTEQQTLCAKMSQLKKENKVVENEYVKDVHRPAVRSVHFYFVSQMKTSGSGQKRRDALKKWFGKTFSLSHSELIHHDFLSAR